MLKVKSSHVYDTPEVYEVIWGRRPTYKMGEARVAAHLVRQHNHKAKRVLELFSGAKSYHKQHFLDAFDNPKLEYFCADGTKSADSSVLQIRDLVAGDWGATFDVVLAHFYSASSIVDFKDGYVKKAKLETLIKNVRTHLKPGGMFMLDSAVDGYQASLTDIMEGESVVENWAEYGGRLWQALETKRKMLPTDLVMVQATLRSYHDRKTSNNVDEVKSIDVLVNGKKVRSYTYDLPFCQRYFSEPEIRELFEAAGFDVSLYSADYVTQDVTLLSDIVDFEIEDGNLESLMPNVFVGIRK